MDKKMMSLIQPVLGLYFIVYLGFSLYAFTYSPPFASAQLVAGVLLYFYYLRRNIVRKREVTQYVEKMNFRMDSANKSSIANFPIPMMIAMASSGEIIWCNDMFFEQVTENEGIISKQINTLIREFDTRWLLDGKVQFPQPVEIEGKYFTVYGNIVRSDEQVSRGILMTLFFMDCTEAVLLQRLYENTKPVLAIMSIDNYDEMLKNATESEKSALMAEINKRIGEWAKPYDGMLRKYDRDRFIFLFSEEDLTHMIAGKFEILEQVRSIETKDGLSPTLSIGIGKEGEHFAERNGHAALALEMALSRGGDQAVIKSKFNFEFFGGATKEVERRTKVKSRVMASAFTQLIRDSSQIIVMGHRNADIDSVGAAIGVVSAVRGMEKPARIVINRKTCLALNVVSKLEALEEYRDTFVTPDEAMMMADNNTLLVVVDTNRPEYVESFPLLESIAKIAVIDHHRRAASYIENSALNMHEPYASSTCEMVTELLQYMVQNQKVLRSEAEALLAGIYLDTKGFTIKAGARTFEAAAYLKRAGGDMVEVKRMFQHSFESYMIKQKIMATAQNYRSDIAIAIADFDVDRATAAQVSDDLLNIIELRAAVVIFRNNEEISYSARSLGDINVQVIMEKLGGGGNFSTAGAQIQEKDMYIASVRLKSAIDEYVLERETTKHKEN